MQAHDGSLVVLLQLSDGQELNYPFLNLIKAEVVTVEDALGFLRIKVLFLADAPG